MRRLLWFAVGFCAACAAGAYFLSALHALLGGCIFLLAVPMLMLFRKRGKHWKTRALVCFGCAMGLFWYALYGWAYLGPARRVDGVAAEVTIEVSDYSYETTYGVGADGWVILEGRPYRVRAYCNSVDVLAPGDILQGTFRFRLTASGGREAPTYHQGKGIFLIAYPVGQTMCTFTESAPWRYAAADLRQKILSRIAVLFPQDTSAFTRALLLGDETEIDYETNTAFKVSGIRHIIAVSGLHVSILFSLICLVTARRRVLTAAVGLPVLFLFAAVVGFTPSVTRACIMMGLMLLALLLNREYDPPTALAFAVLAMLVANPLAVTAVGLQLSVVSVAGIFLFSGRIQGWLLGEKRLGRWNGRGWQGKLVRWFAGSVAISVSAMVLTTPLTAYYFGTISLVGALTNLLTLWVVSLIFYAAMAACLICWIWLPLGKGIAWCTAWAIRYVLWIAKEIAAFPLAAVYTKSPYIIAWLVFCYVLFTGFLFMKKRRPLVLICCAVLGLCLALLCSWMEPLIGDYRVTVLDVGQGQCILLQSKGKSFLVDCGGDGDEKTADIAAETLLAQGVSHLDGLILSHFDRDHVGAAENLLERIPVDMVYLSSAPDEMGVGSRISGAVGGKVCSVDQITDLTYGDMQITLIPDDIRISGNESSLCVLFHTKKCDILIIGDRSRTGERRLMNEILLPKLDVLIVGHHGSDTSTSMELLEATKPRMAVISVGADNPYGHPKKAVLDRLAAFDCLIYRTDTEGTIIIRG